MNNIDKNDERIIELRDPYQKVDDKARYNENVLSKLTSTVVSFYKYKKDANVTTSRNIIIQ